MSFNLPAALAEALEGWPWQGTAPLSSTQQAQLVRYLELLQQWGKTYNLTSVRDPAEMLTLHLLDSLAVRAPLAKMLGAGSAEVLDVGSGGGLPGVVLAATMPSLTVTCVDAVGKKAAFVTQVAAELRLSNLKAQHARVEQLRPRPWRVITSRAFASLQDFVHLTLPLLAPDGVWMAMKGKRPDEEIAALGNEVEVFHVEHLEVPGLDAERCLVWMRRRSR